MCCEVRLLLFRHSQEIHSKMSPSQIFSPVSPLQSADASTLRSNFILSPLNIRPKARDPGHSASDWRPLSARQDELYIEPLPARAHSTTRSSYDRRLERDSRWDRPSRAQRPLVRPPPLDGTSKWERALPGHNSSLLLQPSSMTPTPSEPSPRPSYTSSRLERPFTPNIPDSIQNESSQNLPLTPSRNIQNTSTQNLSAKILDHDLAETKPRRIAGPGYRAHWLSVVIFVIRMLIIAGCVATFALFAYSLSLFNDAERTPTSTESQTNWPVTVGLAPTGVMIAVSFSNFCCSIAIVAMSVRRNFQTTRWTWKDGVRIGLGIFFIGAWVAALLVFKLLENNEGGSLHLVACRNSDLFGNFSQVCVEQVRNTPLRLRICIFSKC